MRTGDLPLEPEVKQELEQRGLDADRLIDEAVGYLEDPDASVDDPAIARMFVERGLSDEAANFLVRAANVRMAPR